MTYVLPSRGKSNRAPGADSSQETPASIKPCTTSRWWGCSKNRRTLSATTGFVLLILGFAFHWQSARAREADVIYDTVRSRIDTALNRGRCGLWDWDIARGRIFWSHSMFAILGLNPRDDLMTFGEVSKLVHPDDLEEAHRRSMETMRGERDEYMTEHRIRAADGTVLWFGLDRAPDTASAGTERPLAVLCPPDSRGNRTVIALYVPACHETNATDVRKVSPYQRSAAVKEVTLMQ